MPKPKRLFIEDDELNMERYTEEALDLDNLVTTFIRPIFDEYISLGYSIRDIASVIRWSVNDAELFAILSRSLKGD